VTVVAPLRGMNGEGSFGSRNDVTSSESHPWREIAKVVRILDVLPGIDVADVASKEKR
jgi:hypothetical protein